MMKFQFALLKSGCAGSIRVIGAESEIDEPSLNATIFPKNAW